MEWFTADQHFFHRNIIKFCDRPYTNLKEMHKELIINHNKCVKETDICYFIGDFAMLRKHEMSKIEPILNKMNGRKILILGNHDEGKPFNYIRMGFESIHTSLELNNGWILVHDPAVATVDKNRQFIVGHVHGLFVKQGNCINVGVDVWDMKPINKETIEFVIRN